MSSTENVLEINLDLFATTRDGKPVGDEGDTVGKLVIVALDQAQELNAEGNGVKPITPGAMRIRTKLADSMVVGGVLTLTQIERDIIDSCVSNHYVPVASGRILACLDTPPPESKDEEKAEAAE